MRAAKRAISSGYKPIHSSMLACPMERAMNSLASRTLPKVAMSGASARARSTNGAVLRCIVSSPTPLMWSSPALKKRRSSQGSSKRKARTLSIVSVSKAAYSGMGKRCTLRTTAPNPVSTVVSSSVCFSVRNGRMRGSMLGPTLMTSIS